jgi:hypothetical protein
VYPYVILAVVYMAHPREGKLGGECIVPDIGDYHVIIFKVKQTESASWI